MTAAEWLPRRDDLRTLLGRLDKGIEELKHERDHARQVLDDRGYPEHDADEYATTKASQVEAAEHYRDQLAAKLDAMPTNDKVDPPLYDQAEMVTRAAELGGFLTDGRRMAEGTVNEPMNQVWDGGAEKKLWDEGTHPAQVKANTIEAAGVFQHVAGEVDGVEQVPIFSLALPAETRAPLDVVAEPDQLVPTQDQLNRGEAIKNEDGTYSWSPTNEEMDWTTEQEERASGLPSAQEADYSEEPLPDVERESAYVQGGEPWSTEAEAEADWAQANDPVALLRDEVEQAMGLGADGQDALDASTAPLDVKMRVAEEISGEGAGQVYAEHAQDEAAVAAGAGRWAETAAVYEEAAVDYSGPSGEHDLRGAAFENQYPETKDFADLTDADLKYLDEKYGDSWKPQPEQQHATGGYPITSGKTVDQLVEEQEVMNREYEDAGGYKSEVDKLVEEQEQLNREYEDSQSVLGSIKDRLAGDDQLADNAADREGSTTGMANYQAAGGSYGGVADSWGGSNGWDVPSAPAMAETPAEAGPDFTQAGSDQGDVAQAETDHGEAAAA